MQVYSTRMLPAARRAAATPRLQLLLPAATKQVHLPPPRARPASGDSWDALPPLRPSNQSLELAFDVVDTDRDGLLSRAECSRLVAYYMALQLHKSPNAAVRPLTWDQHLLASTQSTRQLGGGLAMRVALLCSFLCAKLTGGLQRHPPRASDLLWSAAGMGVAMLALGLLAGAARSWPVVGPLHQQGLPLLLGSFGTLCILLFGKPEAEPVRLWPLVAGQLSAAAIAVATLRLCGPSLWARAAAMATTVAFMQATDCVHPPGGALVLLAMDNAAVQSAGLVYLLWPSLLLSLTILLPISAAVNWLRRNAAFDLAPGGRLVMVATRLTRERDWRHERSLRAQAGALETLTGDEEPPSLPARLAEGLRGALAGLGTLLAWHMQQRDVEQLARRPSPRARMPRDDSAVWSASSSSIEAAGAGAAAAAAALQAAVRRRLRREELERERRLEDRGHRARVWGSADVLPAVEALEERIDKLQEKRLRAEQKQQQQQQQQQQQRQHGARQREWMYRWQADGGATCPQQDGDDGKQGSGSPGAA